MSGKPQVETHPKAQRKSPLDRKTLTAVRAAARLNDWKTVHRLIKPYPTVSRKFAMRESYALIERWVNGSARSPSGWVKLNVDFKDALDAVRIVKGRGGPGKYRLISLKQIVTVERDEDPVTVVESLPKSPKPRYELEQWMGESASGKSRSGWMRIDYPPDYREINGLSFLEWAIREGTLPDTAAALDHLQQLGKPGKFRIITIKRVVHIEMLNGKMRKWSGHCICPDDGRYPEREPLIAESGPATNGTYQEPLLERSR